MKTSIPSCFLSYVHQLIWSSELKKNLHGMLLEAAEFCF